MANVKGIDWYDLGADIQVDRSESARREAGNAQRAHRPRTPDAARTEPSEGGQRLSKTKERIEQRTRHMEDQSIPHLGAALLLGAMVLGGYKLSKTHK
jgi:hypothetical protein